MTLLSVTILPGRRVRLPITGPPVALAAAGLLCSALAVTAGRSAYTANSTPATSWFGLLSPTGFAPGDAWWSGAAVLAAVVGLTLCWLAATAAVARGRLGERGVWLLGGAWSLPLVFGPPLLSKDVYAYAAQGMLARAGADPYRVRPTALPDVAGRAGSLYLHAVDPRWRDVGSPYGPITTVVERAAATLGGGRPLAVLLLLRAVAVISTLVIALAAARLARRRVVGLVLVGLNPLLLVHGLSAAHLDTLMCALVVAALVLAARGGLAMSVVLACLAGLTKAPAFLVVPLIVAWFVAVAWPDRPRALRAAASGTLAAVGTLGLATIALPHAWGWVANLDTPARGGAWSSISDAAGQLARHAAGGGSEAVQAAHHAGLAVAALFVAALFLTAGRRPIAASAGIGLLVLVALGPTFYPWYLLWGLTCLLPAVSGTWPRRLLVGLAVAGTLSVFPGLPGWVANGVSHAVAVGLFVLACRLPQLPDHAERPAPTVDTVRV